MGALTKAYTALGNSLRLASGGMICDYNDVAGYEPGRRANAHQRRRMKMWHRTSDKWFHKAGMELDKKKGTNQ